MDKSKAGVIFRRYITVGGKTLDAHDYGKKAWPTALEDPARWSMTVPNTARNI